MKTFIKEKLKKSDSQINIAWTNIELLHIKYYLQNISEQILIHNVLKTVEQNRCFDYCI